MPPKESMRLDNRCPKCSRRMTVGVEQRIEVLADRPVNYRPPNVPGFVYLLPLQELIATAYSSSVSSRKVQEVYSSLTGAFSDEMAVLLEAPLGDVERIAGKDVAQILSSLRQNTLEVTPGYDGVYGVLKYDRGSESKPIADVRRSRRKGLDAWMP